MSHKAGHIIIQSLKTVPTITSEQCATLDEIAARDEYTLQDRMAIALLSFQLADDEVDDD